MRSAKSMVSICLCTYNGEKFISKQIESYLGQTVLPDEIIVCDDKSDDKTISILQGFIDRNSSIQWQLIQNEKTLGSNRNFEKAIGICGGDIIFLSDQDDIWEPEKIERTIFHFETNPECHAGFSDATLIDDNDNKLSGTLLESTFFRSELRNNYRETDLLYWSLLLGNIAAGASMAIRKNAKSSIIPFRLDMGRKLWHDGWISLSCMAEGKFQFINEKLFRYRVHANQQVGVVYRDDPFVKYILNREFDPRLVREYYQRYLIGFNSMTALAAIKPIDPSVKKRITDEYLESRKMYFNTQPLIKRKLRLLKWLLTNANHITFKDLLTL